MYKDLPDGGREEVGDWNQGMLPGASKTHRVFFDPEKRFYPIDLPKTELDEIAKELRYTDAKTGKLIEAADPRNELDPFFCLNELELEVPNSGVTMDDTTALGKFWLAAARSEPKLFNINNGTDNPAIKRVQEFKIMTAGYSQSEKTEKLQEGKRAGDIFYAKKHDYQWLVNTCRGMGISVASDAKVDALEDAIWLKITDEKDFKINGVRAIERFLELNDMKQDDFETKARINLAIDLKIIAKEGRRYSFDEQLLGGSPDEVFAMLARPENADVKGMILARLEEKSSKL